MHKPCRVIWFTVLGTILALLFLLVAMCGRPDSTPMPPAPTVPVPPVTSPPVVIPPVTPPIAPVPHVHRTYKVVKGDTLWDISEAKLGDPQKWREIYSLNKAIIDCPHWIYPGQVLFIS